MKKTMERDEWPSYVAVVTYGLTVPSPPMENVEPAFKVALNRPSDGGSPDQFLTAVRLALASDVDLAEELGLQHPDRVVREYLRALEARLATHLGE